MIDLREQIDKWNKEGYLIMLLGDLNDYIFIQRSIIFFYRLGIKKIIMDKHGSGGPE